MLCESHDPRNLKLQRLGFAYKPILISRSSLSDTKLFLSRITGQVIGTEAKQQGPQEASPALLDGVLADASGAVPKALAI